MPLGQKHDMERSAEFSEDRRYRYNLVRVWTVHQPRLLFILLNPSTADEWVDDPTNRRGISFAHRWGFGSVVFCNLFAYRSPDPRIMKARRSPIGPDNDAWILAEAEEADKIVCGWGAHGAHRRRHQHIVKLLKEFDLYCLGTTKHGHPKHPLYLRADTRLQRFEPKFPARRHSI